MKKLDSLELIKLKLINFHKNKAKSNLDYFSEIANDQFQGEFNVSGFHKEILDLTEKTNSIWGIDRCLRIQDIPDEIHSFLFHMGIFARSVNLENIFIDPFKDPRFHELQKDIISQFLELLSLFKANFQELEITYFDGADFGATNKGRDRILKRRYKFPSDSFSKNFLKGKVKLFPLKSIMNLDINPIEGSLVGPRMEVAYNGMEIATIVFNCFKVKNGVLVPVNYIGGYAIGIERLASSLKGSGFVFDS